MGVRDGLKWYCGKRCYETPFDATAAAFQMAPHDPRREFMFVYQCQECQGAYHWGHNKGAEQRAKKKARIP